LTGYDRLRIAMIAACPFPWPRGTPIRIHRMAEALAQRGHEVHVVTYHLGGELPDPPFVVHRIRDVPTYRHTAPGPTLRKFAQLDPMLVRLLRRLCREMRFDIVHAHHYEGLLVASRAHQDAPIIYDAHTILAGELPHYRLGLPRWCKRVVGAHLDRRLPKRADRIIAVSESIRDTLVAIGAVAPHLVHVIPNGIDWERFCVEPSVRSDERTVIFAGNLSPYQRVDLLIEAFAALHARRADARLMIVTESSFAPYESLAQQLGVREAIDLRNAPFAQQPALLAAAAVAVNPRTECDGLPQKLLNYMAAAAPIVSFEGSAIHLEHEHTGLRVPNGDTRAMADAIERLLNDRVLARRLGRAAREHVRRDFSWDGIAGRVERVYRESIASRAMP
jgi:glycosyltransferase involved in cell wall biosynthesis